jgi:hypothetical protein
MQYPLEYKTTEGESISFQFEIKEEWYTHAIKFKAFIGDKEVGYILIRYSPKNLFDIYFPNCVHYKYRMAYGSNKLEIDVSKIEINKVWEEKYKLFKKFYLDRPFVSMVYVPSEFRGKHIGMSLYLKMGEYCQNKGMYLHSSDSQTLDAKIFWNKFRQRFPELVHISPYYYTREILDEEDDYGTHTTYYIKSDN